jgi:hypothetical protein
MLEDLVGYAIIPCHSRLIEQAVDVLSNGQGIPPNGPWGRIAVPIFYSPSRGF